MFLNSYVFRVLCSLLSDATLLTGDYKLSFYTRQLGWVEDLLFMDTFKPWV